MDLIEYSDQMGKQIQERRKQAKAEKEKINQAAQDAIKAEKQHEENKRQGMI